MKTEKSKFERIYQKTVDFWLSAIRTIVTLIACILIVSSIFVIPAINSGEYSTIYAYSIEKCEYMVEQASNIIVDDTNIDLEKIIDKEIEASVSTSKWTDKKTVHLSNTKGNEDVYIDIVEADDGTLIVQKVRYPNEIEYKIFVTVVNIMAVLIVSIILWTLIELLLCIIVFVEEIILKIVKKVNNQGEDL